MGETNNTEKWDKVISFIADEKCLLLIGPEIQQNESKSQSLVFREKLYANYEDQIAHYHQHDGLFLFKNDYVKAEISQDLKQLYTSTPYDETIYKTIAQIPFHLVISINPEAYLSDVCFKYNIRHRFSYFKSKEKAVGQIERPTRDFPLVYNLCGSIKDDESLILDYEDLFSLIGSALGIPGLPEELRAALDKIRTYVFLGFSFEKWYTQLLLRIICGDKKYPKYSVHHRFGDDDTKNFLMHQFQIEFLEEDFRFLDQIMESCKEKAKDPLNAHLYRPLSDPASADEVEIIRFISNNDLDKAVSKLVSMATGTALSAEAAAVSSRYYQWRDDKAGGKIDSRDLVVTFNQVVDAILKTAKEIAKTKAP
ncbi:MAG: SIR2 family protein [Saprospiraceae bacterium]|nr:SIR2 family protein [Saprospiraceae bacterium]